MPIPLMPGQEEESKERFDFIIPNFHYIETKYNKLKSIETSIKLTIINSTLTNYLLAYL